MEFCLKGRRDPCCSRRFNAKHGREEGLRRGLGRREGLGGFGEFSAVEEVWMSVEEGSREGCVRGGVLRGIGEEGEEGEGEEGEEEEGGGFSKGGVDDINEKKGIYIYVYC